MVSMGGGAAAAGCCVQHSGGNNLARLFQQGVSGCGVHTVCRRPSRTASPPTQSPLFPAGVAQTPLPPGPQPAACCASAAHQRLWAGREAYPQKVGLSSVRSYRSAWVWRRAASTYFRTALRQFYTSVQERKKLCTVRKGLT